MGNGFAIHFGNERVLKVVVTAAGLSADVGGPARTVPALCKALSKLGVKVELCTVGNSLEAGAGGSDGDYVTTAVMTSATKYRPMAWAKEFCLRVRQAIETSAEPTVLYDVGLWLPSNHFVAKIARGTRTPLIISPRGMLSARALRVARLKKKVAWQVYQKRDLAAARVLHATSESEAEDIRSLGSKQRIAVIPNGTHFPAEIVRVARNSEPRTVLFLSRLHPIKGLADLVNAWARVRPVGWRAVIVGPDENNYRREIERLVASFGLEAVFEFAGPTSDVGKWKFYEAADLFVLPSHSESFGLAIAEALASGVPVITTDATPWKEIEEKRAGWRIAPGADALTLALDEATRCSDTELKEMGERGREFVCLRFSWDTVALKMADLFRWIVHGGDRPEYLR